MYISVFFPPIYLSLKGLSHAYQSVSEVGKEVSRKMKNAKALHIIQLSCGKQIQDELSHCKTARSAWNHLSIRYSKSFKINLDKVQQVSGLSKEHKDLLRMVERGESIDENAKIDQEIFDKITFASDRTLLHVAVIAGNVKNVEKLVTEGKDEFVKKQDTLGHTALALAARYNGEIDIVRCMVDSEIGEKLLKTRNTDREIPVLLAAANGHKEMTSYLYSKTPRVVFDKDSQNRVLLLERCITVEIFDVALRLLKLYPNLLIESLSLANEDLPEESSKFSALVTLAKLQSSFPSSSRFGLVQQFIYDILNVEKEFEDNYEIAEFDIEKFVWSVTRVTDSSPHKNSSAKRRLLRGFSYLFDPVFKHLNILGIRDIYDKKYSHYEVLGILKYFSKNIEGFDDLQLRQASAYEAMLCAAQNGIVEFINAMRDANSDLLSVVDNSDRGIFWYAILNRRESVFRLMYFLNGLEKEMFRYCTDAFGNNLLHMAALFDPSSNRYGRSGATMQIQREIQWFQAVKEVVHPKCMEAKNEDGKTPYDIFTESHEELMKVGEQWTKDTARSYVAVASLVLTIMFAAAFTVPHVNNQNTGKPVSLHENMFTVFLIADVVAISNSSISLLVFILILTSRYAEIDFLVILPSRLLFGFFFLTVSICSMMVAFYAALSMILEGHDIDSRWFGPMLAYAAIPTLVLLPSQFHLVYGISFSLMKHFFINKQVKHVDRKRYVSKQQ